MIRKFDQLLNAYWLRPESAIWRYIDIISMERFNFKTPSLDFGAGDGMFSFIRAGGELSHSFDAFQSITNLDEFFKGSDVYDSFNPSSKPIITKLPDYNIDVAFDHKENLLRKAATLNIYNNFKVGDGNSPLPFDSNSFASIFSNILYWLDDPQKVLKELKRILRPDGHICLMLPNTTLPEFSFYNSLYIKSKDDRWKFLEMLDRGRFSDNVKHAKSSSEWEKLFHNADLVIDSHTQHLSKPIIQLWDIGLRPLFPVLMEMIQAVQPEKLQQIKQHWISIFKQFLEPMIMIDKEYDEFQPAFHCYILKK